MIFDSPIPRRVLMTADTVGGVWSYSMELCRGLGDAGVEVILATMGAPVQRDQRMQASALQNVELCESSYALEWMNSPWDDVERAGEWLMSLDSTFSPDVIHLNGYVHGTLSWGAPTLVVGHSCVLSWWRAVKGEDVPLEWQQYAERVKAGLERADLVVAPTRAMLNALVDHYGPFANARVIPNGCAPFAYSSEPKEPFVLCVGRLWDEAKNARALADVADDIPWPVRVVGESKSPDGERVTFPNVELLGRMNAAEVKRLLFRAAIYALPARYEPFGLSVLEAALSRCALILGDIPSLRENWESAALFVDPADRDGLLNAVKQLVDDTRLRSTLGLKAQARARGLTRERMANGYLEAYTSLRSAGSTTTSP